MRYQIPKEKNILEQEQRSMVLAAGDHEAARIQKALMFVADYAGNGERYEASPQESYRALHEIYTELELGENASVDEMFPEKDRSKDNFQAELEKLWRVLELHSLLQEPNLSDTYRQYQEETEYCDDRLRQEEQRELRAPHQKLETSTFVRINSNSPYYPFVSGTAYMELQESFGKIEKQPSAPTFSDDAKKLLSALQLHYIRRGANGNVLPMTGDEYKEVTGLYKKCMEDLDQFPKSEKKKSEYKVLHSLLDQNLRELQSLSSGELPPLAEAIHGAKGSVIHLQDTENNTVGKAMSSRETVEYIDEHGKLRQGLFTPEKPVASWKKEAKEFLNRLSEEHPQYAHYFKKLKDDPKLYSKLRSVAHWERKNPESELLQYYFSRANWIDRKDKTEDFYKIFRELAGGIEKIRNTSAIYAETQIQVNDLTAKRSSAMSDVANALGFPDLLVKSRQVTVKRGDKEVPGTMMDIAGPDTVDPLNIGRRHPFYNMDASEFDKKEVLKSLADLQILDYLCGNTDRHSHNYFLKMDFSDPKKPKLLGVQGIDNDDSFGSIEDGGVIQLAKRENLKLITSEMSQAIAGMRPEKLEEILKPYAFSEDQVIAAQVRLLSLQKMIDKQLRQGRTVISDGKLVNQKGAIYIASNEDMWKHISLDTLIPEGIETEAGKKEIPNNIFYSMDSHRDDLLEYQAAMKGSSGLRPRVSALYDGAVEKPMSYNDHGIKKFDYEKLQELQVSDKAILSNVRELFDAHGGLDTANRTAEFTTMSRSLNRYIRTFEQLDGILRGEEDNIINPEPNAKNAKESKDKKLKECMNALEEARKNLGQSVDQYCRKKYASFLKGDNRERYDIAKKLQKTLKDPSDSAKFYQSSMKLQEQHKKMMDSKTDFQLAAFMSEQIGSQMKLALRNNLNQLIESDPVRVKGIRTLKAQERLWNYSQSVVSDNMLSMKRIEGNDENAQKERTSFKLMQYKIRQKNAEKPDLQQLYADMETVRDYIGARMQKGTDRIEEIEVKLLSKPRNAQKLTEKKQAAEELLAQDTKLKELIQDMLDHKETITPRGVRSMLDKVYKNELQIAKKYQPTKNKEQKANLKQ